MRLPSGFDWNQIGVGMPHVSDPGAVDGMSIQFLDVLVEPGLEVCAVLQQMADRAVP